MSYTDLPFPNQLATHVTTAGHPDDCTRPPIICVQRAQPSYNTI